MDINVTLFGEMLTFAVLVWATMKYIWPPLLKIIKERQEKIAAGLEASKRGHDELELVRADIIKQLQQAKAESAKILEQADHRANILFEEGKLNAQVERAKILAQAKLDLEQEVHKAKNELQRETVDLVVAAVEKILQQKVSKDVQDSLINKLISKI